MTSCVGYLGITINDRMELQELFRYDILVTCPPHFNVTFSLPIWSSRPDRTFDVILDDAHSSYRVFVTTITFHGDEDAVTCAADTHSDDVIEGGVAVRRWSVAAYVSVVHVIASVLVLGACGFVILETSYHTTRCQMSPADDQEVALTGNHQGVALTGSRQAVTITGSQQEVSLTGSHQRVTLTGSPQGATRTGSHLAVALTGSRQGVALNGSPQGFTPAGSHQEVSLTGSHQRVTLTGSPHGATPTGSHLAVALTGSRERVTLTGSPQGVTPTGSHQEVALTGSSPRHLGNCDRRRRRLIVVVHVLLRVIFALSCTFTVCSTVFYISQQQRLDHARQLPAVKRHFDAAAAAARDRLTVHVATRPVADVVRVQEMQMACDGYISELSTAVANRVAVAARAVDGTGHSAVRMYRRAARRIAGDMERFVADIRRRIGVHLRPAASVFRRVVRDLLNSPWLSYARNLCNKSVECSAQNRKSPSTSRDDVSFLLPPDTSTFAEFLRIFKVEETESWHDRFLER